MRFNEFAGTHSLTPISEAVLLEIDFNSKSVQQQALSAPIMCGFEAETIWPSLGSGMSEDDVYDEVNDLTWDEFRSSEYSSEMTSREERAIEQAYRDWAIEEKFPDIESEMIEKWVDANIDDYTEEYFDDEHTDSDLDDWLEENDSSIDDYGVEDSSESKKRLLAIEDFVISEHGSEYREWLDEYARQNDEVTDAAMDRAIEFHTLDDWIYSEYGSMMEMLNNHDVFIDVDSDGNLQEVADIIETELDVSAVVGSYHSGTTDESTDDWRVEEDSSLSGPGVAAEIISPVYDSPQKMLSVMRDLFDVLQDNSVETQSAYDTGLHITMSWAGDTSPTNRLKMALLLGDEHVLETFGRLGNSYARSMMKSLRQAAADKNTELVNTTVENIEGELSKNIRLQKYSAINFKSDKNSQGNEIIEFRAAGGDDYHLNMKRIQDTVVRYAAIMRAGHDAAAYRKDYVSSIFRLLNNAAQPGTNIAGTEFVPAPKNQSVKYQKKTYISNGDGTWNHDGKMVVSKRLNRILNDLGGKNVASKGSADIKTHNSIKPAADLLYNFANQNNLSVKTDLAGFAKTYSEFVSRYGDNEQIVKQLGLVSEDTHSDVLQSAKDDLHKLKNSFAGILINLALALGKNSKTPLKITAAIRKIGKRIGFDYQTDIMSPDVVEWRQKSLDLRAQTVAAINSVLKLTTPLKFTYLEMNRRVMHNIAMMYLRATNAQKNHNIKDAVKKLSQLLLSDSGAAKRASRFDTVEDYDMMLVALEGHSHLFAEHSSDDRFQQAVQYVNTLPELDRSDLASTSAVDGIYQIRRLFTQVLTMLREEYNNLPQTQQAQFVQTLHRLVDSIAVYLDNPTITRYHYLPPSRDFEETQDVLSLLHRLYYSLPTDITHLADAVKNSDDPEETKQKVIAMLNQILSELAKTSQQLGVKMPGAIDLNKMLGESMTYDDFVTLPLQEQMATVDKLDTVKLNEAWSKKYKRSIDCDNPKGFSQREHCAGKRKRRKSESVSEGVPNLDPERAVKKLLSDHFPVGDVGKQMQAYAAVPVPEMLSDFRHLHAEQGADACARGILRNYAEWYFSKRPEPSSSITEAVAIVEAKGLYGRDMGDQFGNASGEVLTFQQVESYPQQQPRFQSPEQRDAAIEELETQLGSAIQWTNSANRASLAFGIATLVDQNDQPVYWGRYFQSVRTNMLGAWDNKSVPLGWKLMKATSEKMDLGVDPQALIKTENKFSSVEEVIQTVATNSAGNELSDQLVSALTSIVSEQLPDFPENYDRLSALRDYFGEIMAPVAVMSEMVGGQMADAKQALLPGAEWKDCAVYWPQSMTYNLVDSVLVAPDGTEIGISSKGGSGAKASAKNLSDAIDKSSDEVKQQHPYTVDVMQVITQNTAKEGPFRLAEFLDVLPAGLEDEIKGYIDEGKADFVGISDDATELLDYGEPREEIANFNAGYALLALLAKKCAGLVNENPEFSEGARAFLNNSSMIQVYTRMGKRGNTAVVNAFDAVYPPNFSGTIQLDHSKNYTSTEVRGKFGFGFVK